jgi:hypothetical protein
MAIPGLRAAIGAAMTALFLTAALLALPSCRTALAQKDSGQAQNPAAAAVRLAAVGDIMLGTENLLPPDGARGFFTEAAPYLKGRDVVFGNLEGPLTDRGAPSKDTSTGRSFCFRSPPSYGRLLKEAGFSVVSLANNHANDYGPEGREQTVEVLESLGILHTGAPGQIAWARRDGPPLAFIGLAPNAGCQDINDIPGAVALVKRALAKDPKALVVVSMHGGAEGSGETDLPMGPELFMGENRGDLRRLSHALIDAGAAMVIGHGPHVPRGAEVYKDRLIAYSLGNFATAAGINVKGNLGLAPLLLAELDRSGRVLAYEFISFRQKMNQGPRLDASGEAAKLIEAMSLRIKNGWPGRP